jgi:VWFA-related protein
MKTILGGSTALILAVLISTGFLMGGCGGGGGSGSGSDTSNTPTKPIPPDINVSANQLLFGGIVQNNFTDRTITIQNRGTQNLNIGRIAQADPLAPPFSIENDNCSLNTLASLRTCTLLVRFSPPDQNHFEDSFDIPSNDPDENPVTVTVSGDGKGLNVSINQVDTSNCPTVRLYVTVSQSNGDPQTGLLQNHFSVFENNMDPLITYFEENPNSPKSIALVLDYSASMLYAKSDMEEAAVYFIDQLAFDLDPAVSDEAEIIRYAQGVEPSLGFTHIQADLNDAIGADYTGDNDGTAMYDAVRQAVDDTAARDIGRRRAVIVIADGKDNSSFNDLTDVIDYALEKGVPVFTIGLGEVNAEIMQQLADETGGQYYLAPNETELQNIYFQISEIISSQYILVYNSLSSGSGTIILDVEVDYNALQGEDSRETIGCP